MIEGTVWGEMNTSKMRLCQCQPHYFCNTCNLFWSEKREFILVKKKYVLVIMFSCVLLLLLFLSLLVFVSVFMYSVVLGE